VFSADIFRVLVLVEDFLHFVRFVLNFHGVSFVKRGPVVKRTCVRFLVYQNSTGLQSKEFK
jgi:hypothetical protein